MPTENGYLYLVNTIDPSARFKWERLVKDDVGLTNVDNTSDANKPVSTATANALAGKVGRGELFLSVKDFGAVCDGVANDTTALQAAITTAQGRVLVIPGACLVTANLTGLHGVIFAGSGKIVRSGVTFYTKPTGTQTNTLYVDPAGSDTNDGLTNAFPFLTFQAAFDALKLYGPVLDGKWEIVAAPGTYPVSAGQQTLTTRSVNRVVVRGPVVGASPAVPTAIIDGAGGAAYSHGLSASGVGVRVEFRDLKGINFTTGAGDTTRIPFLGENESDFYANNIHATGASWTGIYAFNTVRARVYGGVVDACRDGVVVNDTDATVGMVTAPVTIKNSTEFGLYWSRGSQGHADYVNFESNATALMIDAASRVDTVGCDFRLNNVAISTRTGGIYNEGGVANTYNNGTVNANTTNFDFKAGSGNGTELAAARSWMSPAYDRATHTLTGTTALTVMAPNIYTVAARRLQGVGKQLRVHAQGVHTVTAGSSYTVTIGGMSLLLTVPAAATAVPFEIDVQLLEVQGGYRAIGAIRQGLSAQRYGTATSGFDATADSVIGISATPAATGDSLTIYHTDVYLLG